MTDTSSDFFEHVNDVDSAAGPIDRARVDRRRKPTPILSRYWLSGRRRGSGRRLSDSPRVYVDRYTRVETVVVLWLLFASIADLALTLVHLSDGGAEANPVMAWFLVGGGVAGFAFAKLLLTAIPVLFLLLHARFRGTWPALVGLAVMYACILGYHAVAAWDRIGG